MPWPPLPDADDRSCREGRDEMGFSMSAPAAPPPATPFEEEYIFLIRAEDQLFLWVYLELLTLEPSGMGHVLRPGVTGGYILVYLPPQHCMESANTRLPDEAKGQRSAMGQMTRLAFRVDRTTPPIPFTVEGILAALPTLSLVVPSNVGLTEPLPAPGTGQPAAAVLAASADRRAAARVTTAQTTQPAAGAVGERGRRSGARLRAERAMVSEAAPSEAAPAEATTAALAATEQIIQLRLPSRLELTPRGGATAFSHAARAVTYDGRTEVWHTRLAQHRADGRLVEVPADLIAMGTHELSGNPQPADWGIRVGDARLAGALTRSVREHLVNQTKLEPLIAEQLMLSGLGAWLDAERDFTLIKTLQSYRHRMVMGRDVLVRSVLKGRLYPFGHEAMLTLTTVRHLDPVNGELATLVTQSVVTVRQPIRTFTGTAAAERAWPWASVRLLTRSTPGGDSKPFAAGATMLHVGGSPFMFRCLGVDRGGRTSTFQLPLVFVEDGAKLGPVVTAYRNQPGLRTVAMTGQTVSVASPAADAPEATDVVADSIVINMVAVSGSGDSIVAGATTDSITGKLPSLQRFVPDMANTSLALNYATAYVNHGFGNGNAGQLVLQLAGNQAVQLLDLADKAVTGGLAAPSFSMNAISRLTGPVGGNLANLASGKVKVADLLKQSVGDVKLLGVFSLADLIGPTLELEIAGADPAKRVPQLITDAIDGVSVPRFYWEVDLFKGPGMKPGDGVLAPKDTSVDAGPVQGSLSAIDGATAKLIIEVATELEQPVNPKAPKVHTRARCRVENVKLTMGGLGRKLVSVPFKHISFESKDGRKPDFDAGLGEIEFFGALAFVRTLAALIPYDGFYDPPALDITDEKISSSFALPVPAVSAGMFCLENITFSAALDLWFAKPPELSLNFATFDNRFRLTVLALGGGGYLGLTLSTSGLERLDGALEFGAALSVHLGIARGSVSVMGGIQFTYDRQLGPMLSGYLEVRGEVEVLCLVEVGVSLLVVLSYEFETGELTGRAQLEVRIKVVFFKKTVRVPFSYTLAGAGNGDGERRALPFAAAAAAPTGMPGFLDQMAPRNWPAGQPTPWETYCKAFA